MWTQSAPTARTARKPCWWSKQYNSSPKTAHPSSPSLCEGRIKHNVVDVELIKSEDSRSKKFKLQKIVVPGRQFFAGRWGPEWNSSKSSRQRHEPPKEGATGDAQLPAPDKREHGSHELQGRFFFTFCIYLALLLIFLSIGSAASSEIRQLQAKVSSAGCGVTSRGRKAATPRRNFSIQVWTSQSPTSFSLS